MAEATINIKVSWREAGLILKALEIVAGLQDSKPSINDRYEFSRLAKQLANRKEK